MVGLADPLVKAGDRVLLVSEEGDEFLIQVSEGKFSTHLGVIDMKDLMGIPYGGRVKSSKGVSFYVLRAGYVNEVFHLKRKTQIVYPKDSGYILLMLDVREGDRVVDVGVGSGVMSYLFARAVGEKGRVYAYEKRDDFANMARENLRKWGVLDRVEIKLKDISEGIEEKNVDAFFLDVPDPWEHIETVWKALKGGGRFCTVVPTTNQVQRVLEVIEKLPFTMVEVWESLFREYKPVPERLRPFDRMVAHTTYMIFAIKVFGGDEGESGEDKGDI